MKKYFIILAAAICLFVSLELALFISSDIRFLEPHEREKIAEGKTFWKWSSPYGNLSIHYIEKGEGSNHLLLLHGFRAHTYTWHQLMDPLAEAGYHVWAIDFIGYGLSDKPEDVPYDFDFFLEQIKNFMDAKGIVNAHLVGNSLGGGLALNFALSHSQYTSSLTLISALGYPLEMPFYISIARYFSQIWLPFLGPTWVRNTLEQIVYDQKNISDQQVEAYCLPYQFPGGVLSTLLTLRQFDNQKLIEMQKQYPSLQVPILLIWGEKDTLIPLDYLVKFIQDFPQAESLVIKNCGHIPQEEEPMQVINTITNFLHKMSSNNKDF